MTGNPEFRRNLWLELTPARLIGMPAVLTATFVLIALLAPDRERVSLTVTTVVLYNALVFLWGTRQAAEAVVIELRDRTWDGQRMSAIGPWSMTWGKLFGSAIYPWYGGLLCLAVYVALTFDDPGSRTLMTVLLFLTCGLLAHASALLSSMQAMIKERRYNRSQTSAFLVLGVLLAGPFMSIGLNPGAYVWMGTTFSGLGFAVLSVLAFLFWSVLGIYRLMRTELQIKSGPLAWISFVGFLALYFAGFPNDPESAERIFLRTLIAYIVTLLAVYLMAFSERKDPVEFRRLIASLRQREWLRMLQDLPCWGATLLPVLFTASWTVLSADAAVGFRRPGTDPATFVAASFLFLLRDLGLMLFFNLAQNRKRADMVFLLNLVLLYGVIPGILTAVNLDMLTVLFWPRWDAGFWPAAAAAAAEVLLMLMLVARRWKARYAVAQPVA